MMSVTEGHLFTYASSYPACRPERTFRRHICAAATSFHAVYQTIVQGGNKQEEKKQDIFHRLASQKNEKSFGLRSTDRRQSNDHKECLLDYVQKAGTSDQDIFSTFILN